MADVTIGNSGQDQYTTVQGPIKVEVASITIVSDEDTYQCLMQRPVWALFVQNTDGNADAIGVNAAISGKTITFNHSSISSTVGSLLVYGF